MPFVQWPGRGVRKPTIIAQPATGKASDAHSKPVKTRIKT
jgi:hypothetical protein